jgi:hypothetical protein
LTSTAFARRSASCRESGRAAETRLRWMLFAGCAVQFALLASLSAYESKHAALSRDFAIYYQAFWLIAHGDLHPFCSIDSLPFVQIHANFLMWPLGAIGAIWSDPLALKLTQDAAFAGASFLALLWSEDVLLRGSVESARSRRAFLFVALFSLILNPWIYESSAFDFHFYAISALALVGLGRALYRSRTLEAVLWAAFGISAGDVTTTQMAACAFGLAFAVPRARKAGLAIAAAAAAWFVLLVHAGLVKGDILAVNYSYLAKGKHDLTALDVLLGLLEHPQIVAGKVAAHWDLLFANLSPGGFAGLISPLTGVPVALTLFENLMSSTTANFYIAPGNENGPIYALMAPGLAWLLALIYRRFGSRPAIGLALFAAANAACWFCLSYPGIAERWSRVPEDNLEQIDRLEHLANADDEVIASWRFIGAFAGRRSVYSIVPGESVPLRERRTFVVLLALEGVPKSYAAIAALANLPHARLLSFANDLWMYEIDRTAPGTFVFPRSAPAIQGNVLTTDYGRRDFAARAMSTEHAPASGYLVRGAYWWQPPGAYVARASVESSAPVELEVWGVHSLDRPVARARFPHGGQLAMPFRFSGNLGYRSDAGTTLFRHDSDDGARNGVIDLRVRVAPGAKASVKDVALTLAGALPPDQGKAAR